jgi:hypothetical protein
VRAFACVSVRACICVQKRTDEVGHDPDAAAEGARRRLAVGAVGADAVAEEHRLRLGPRPGGVRGCVRLGLAVVSGAKSAVARKSRKKSRIMNDGRVVNEGEE